MATSTFLPVASKEDLKKEFVGKSLKDGSAPAAILDIHKVKINCARMLKATAKLDFGWRAHIKTHKTNELTQLQVGDAGPVNIIVSTILEAENLLPLLLDYKEDGRAVNLLYSFPIYSGAVPRLSALNKALGPNGLTVMVDHPVQLSSVIEIFENTLIAPCIFIKIDMGGHRAGVIPTSETCSELISQILSLEALGKVNLLGLYSHAGHSYSGSNTATALDFLRQEFEALLITAESVHSASPDKKIVLTVGATPTTTSVRNLLLEESELSTDESREISALRATITAITSKNCTIELHAGVYPTLDLQQLSTHALPSNLLAWDDIAITVMAEVASVYPGRGKGGITEVLVTAGSLALGREPCKAYPGWGILTPWNREGAELPKVGVEDYPGWQVGKISQEHGILTYKDSKTDPLMVGQKVRIWPNHACIAGAGFDWYLIVDSGRDGKEDEVIDVWPRWRGW